MRRAIRALEVVSLALALATCPAQTKAEVNPYGEPWLIESTAYCDEGITASGCQTREGIIAAKKEWIGKVAILYTVRDDGLPEYMGIYEIKDTGGDHRIKEGKCIDIWMPTKEECIEWGRRKVYIQIVDGEG